MFRMLFSAMLIAVFLFFLCAPANAQWNEISGPRMELRDGNLLDCALRIRVDFKNANGLTAYSRYFDVNKKEMYWKLNSTKPKDGKIEIEAPVSLGDLLTFLGEADNSVEFNTVLDWLDTASEPNLRRFPTHTALKMLPIVGQPTDLYFVFETIDIPGGARDRLDGQIIWDFFALEANCEKKISRPVPPKGRGHAPNFREY